MNDDNNIEDALDSGSVQEPPQEELFAELQTAMSDADEWQARCARAEDTRFCKWSGQSADGRKHGRDLGYDPAPWEGASDSRIRTADEVIQEQVLTMLASLRRASFQAAGIGIEDMSSATRISQLLRWQFQVQMRDQLRRELELAAQMRQEFGASVTCVQWNQEFRRVPVEVRGEDIIQTLAAPMLEAAQGNGQLDQMSAAAIVEEAGAAFLDPLRTDEMADFLRQLYPLATAAEARKALEALRAGEVATLDEAEIFGGGPRLTALEIMRDVFFPSATWDLQRARWIAHRELVTETELRDRINSSDYNEEWVEKAIEQKGQSFTLLQWNRNQTGWQVLGQSEETKDLVEIFHFYYKVSTRGGVPQVRKCVLHPGVPEMQGWSGPMPYAHGQYPYVLHRREHTRRPILESRGIAEIADTWQREIKAQRDSRVDRTSLTTLPPVLVPPTRGASRLTFGPGVQWPKRRGEEIEWMKVPPFDGASIEIEKATERNVDRYFGRISENNPPDRALLHQQGLVDSWLGELEQIASMVLALDQQYLPDEIAIRVMNQPVRMSRGEIQGSYDLQLVFDVRNLNAELLKEKLELINTMVLPLDRFGVIDLAKMVQMTLGSIDPTIAEIALQDIESASQKQVAEEQDILAKMVAGIETPMEPAPGMNYQLRLQTLQQSIQANPELQQMLQGRPILAKMVEARMEFLGFQVQQQQNAITGRVGAQPVLQNQQP